MITHVIGFGTTPEDQAVLSGIAEKGGGLLLGAGNATELRDALFSVLEELQIIVGAGYVGGNAFGLVPQGDPNTLAVVARGPVNSLTSTMPLVVRNNTGDDVVGLKVSVTVRDAAGNLLGAANALDVKPFFVRAGGLAFGSMYFSPGTTFPSDASFEFEVTPTRRNEAQFAGHADLDITEAALFENRIAGTAKNGFQQQVKGPLSFSAACFDEAGNLFGVEMGFSDSGALGPGASQSFQVDLFSVTYAGYSCPAFLVAGQGFGPVRLPAAPAPKTASSSTPTPAPQETAQSDGNTSTESSPSAGTSEAGNEPSSAACPAFKTAEDVVVALRDHGLPIGEYEVYTAETDPNELLGRPNGYTSKVNFQDTTLVPETSTFEVVDGGTVEVFNTPKQAQARKDYIDALGAASPLFVEYTYVQGPILLRLSKRLLPDQSEAYNAAFQELAACD